MFWMSCHGPIPPIFLFPTLVKHIVLNGLQCNMINYRKQGVSMPDTAKCVSRRKCCLCEATRQHMTDVTSLFSFKPSTYRIRGDR